MSMATTKPWPPPPDLESIQEIVRDADVEGLIATHGAPSDEYEPEGKAIFDAIKDWTIAELTVPNLLPALEGVWSKNFASNNEELALRRPALEALAEQIATFFGPAAQPRVRS
jgi:hypothetical protein